MDWFWNKWMDHSLPKSFNVCFPQSVEGVHSMEGEALINEKGSIYTCVVVD